MSMKSDIEVECVYEELDKYYQKWRIRLDMWRNENNF